MSIRKDGDECGCAEAHYYGGQAVIEGVMMRGTDRYAVAVRRMDGEVVVAEQALVAFADRHKWAKWPLIRGNVGLIEGLVLGMKALFWSADVLTQEENERLAAEKKAEADEAAPEVAPEPDTSEEQGQHGGLNEVSKWGTLAVSFAIAIGIFVLLPTWAVDWFMGHAAEDAPRMGADAILRNVTEGGIRLGLMILYIVAISRMEYVDRLFQYHGAEHATINCHEAGEPITAESCLRFSPLHPRCGTAFLFVVIIVKIILGWFFGWPDVWLRMVIRFGLLPIVAGIGYEIIRWAGRHRNSLFSRVLAAPGMLMQVLTTRKPTEEQTRVAIYSLAAVAPEIGLPEGWPEARRLPIPLKVPQPAPTAQSTETGN